MGLNIIIESNIPFAQGLLEPYAQVSYLPPLLITPEAMRDADALITRTRTRCDAALLDGSRCSIIASATIGLDHVDREYCRGRGIEVANAPGCNAPAVAQYVLASIIAAYGTDLNGLTIGIVGVGHVGSIVERWAAQSGMNVLRCDPPRAESEDSGLFVDIDEIAHRADIITFHTPYTRTGKHATHHICDDAFLGKLQRRPMIINSARGAIVETDALKAAIESGRVSRAVIDCWEGEPDIDRQLLAQAFIATPHIAGYSRQGKIRATQMAVNAVARHFALPCPVMSEQVPEGAATNVTTKAISDSYNPLADTEELRMSPDKFEHLRNHYHLREEVI